MTTSTTVLYREVQRYSELPPFTLLAAVGMLFGWFLIVWIVALGRPLGALDLPPAVALGIGLPLGLLLPLAYARMQMVIEVHPDRVRMITWPSGKLDFLLTEVTEVSVREDRIRDDYDHRRIGIAEHTHTAYTVTTDKGVQLVLTDGRRILIGSKTPGEFGVAVTAAWQAVHESSL
ncbi:MAG: hypothetical protein R6X18_10645 [Chloroflexota bacterium]|jgi:hypothetical protein